MDAPEFIELLRGATEDDVIQALENAYVSVPLSDPVELLEFFNRMIDVLTGDSDAADAMDLARIASARPGSD